MRRQYQRLITISHWLAAALLLCAFVLTSGSAARADEYDIAVQAFSEVAGNAAGIKITQDERQFITPLARCLGHGGKVGDCAAQALVAPLPPDAQAFTKCMVLDREPIGKCAVRGVVHDLPENVRDAISCLESGDSALNCGIAKLPESVQPLAKCLAKASDPTDCGKRYVETQAEQGAIQAFDTITGEANAFAGEVKGPISNIIGVATGIAQNDWVKVIANGGSALAKVAGHIVLAVFLTPVGADALGPVVDYAVDNRVDLVSGIIKAARVGDVGSIAQILVEANLGYSAGAVCAMIDGGVPVTGPIKTAVCGAIGDVIAAVGGLAKDGVDKVAELVHFDDIFDLAKETVEREFLIYRQFFAGKDFHCTRPSAFFADKFARCYTRGAVQNIADSARASQQSRDLYMACRAEYSRCLFKDKADGFKDTLDKICKPMEDRYDADTATLTQALQDAAKSFVLHHPGEALCRPRTDDQQHRLELDCQSALETLFPPSGFIDTSDCKPPPQAHFGGTFAYEQICHTAIESSEDARTKICMDSLRVENSRGLDCMSNQSKKPDGTCGCDALEIWDGKKCVPSDIKVRASAVPCLSNMEKTADGSCVCPARMVWTGTRCSPSGMFEANGPGIKVPAFRPGSFSGGILLRCMQPRPVGLYPNCCPLGYQFIDGACHRNVYAQGPALSPGPPIKSYNPNIRSSNNANFPGFGNNAGNVPAIQRPVLRQLNSRTPAIHQTAGTKMCRGRRIFSWQLCGLPAGTSNGGFAGSKQRTPQILGKTASPSLKNSNSGVVPRPQNRTLSVTPSNGGSSGFKKQTSPVSRYSALRRAKRHGHDQNINFGNSGPAKNTNGLH